MDNTTGPSDTPDGQGLHSATQPESSAFQDWFHSIFNTYTLNNLYDQLLGLFCVGLFMYALGTVFGRWLNNRFAVLKPAAPQKFKIQRIDVLTLFCGWVVIWVSTCLLQRDMSKAAPLATTICMHWIWLWLLGVQTVSRYTIEERVARLLALGFLVPVVRSGIIVVAPLLFMLSGVNYHGGGSQNEKYFPIIGALEIAVVVAALYFPGVAVRREIARRERLPAPEPAEIT